MSGERGRDQDQMDGAALTMPETIRQLRAIADELAAKDINVPIYDEEEIYHNCTVQVWRNSKTGEVSIGWWKEDEDENDLQ